MEVRRGYKQTEVGVIPEDWVVKRLGDLAPIQTGNTPPTRDPRNYGDEFLFVSPVDMGSSKYISRTEKMLAKKGFSISRPFPAGSVLFVCIGSTIGKSGVAPVALTSNQQINAVFPSETVTTDYLYYAVSAAAGRIRSLAGEQAVPIVNKTQFSETAISLPSTRAEQEAIAGALSDADALIESLGQLLTKKRQIKQGAMQELLTGKKRLPGFEVRPGYKQTEVGAIPEDWNAATLGDMTAKVGSGITPTGGSRVYKQEGRPFLRSQNVGWGSLLLGDIAYIDEETHSRFRDTEIAPSDVFLNITGASIGRSAVADARVQSGNVNQHVCIIRTDQTSLQPAFLNYFLLSTAGQRQIDSFQAGGNRQGLNFGQVRSFRLPLPTTLAEQTAIAAVLSDMDAEIAALETKLTKARQVKQGMMQELLTGRIRLA